MAQSVGGAGASGVVVGGQSASSSEFAAPGARWLSPIGKTSLTKSEKLTMARMDIDAALRTCKELGWIS